MIGYELVLIVLDLIEFIIKLVKTKDILWVADHNLLYYQTGYILLFNIGSFILMIWIYRLYLKLESDEYSIDLKNRDKNNYNKIYRV